MKTVKLLKYIKGFGRETTEVLALEGNTQELLQQTGGRSQKTAELGIKAAKEATV